MDPAPAPRLLVSPRAPARLGWGIGTAVAALFVALAAAPAVLEGAAGHVVHAAFGWLCHQDPDRSFALAGSSVALCHRCSGIALGVLAGMLAAPVALRPALAAGRRLLGRVPRRHRTLAAAGLAAVPTALDWTVGALGVWANTPASRVTTGLTLGVVVGLVLSRALLYPPVTRPALSPSSL